MTADEEQALREAAEPLGAEPDSPIEEVVALLEAAGVDRKQPGRATRFFRWVGKRFLDSDARAVRRYEKRRYYSRHPEGPIGG